MNTTAPPAFRPSAPRPRIAAALACCLALLAGTSTAQETPVENGEEAAPPTDPAVLAEIEATAEQDLQLQRTLEARYARIEALANVHPEVAAGVVTLRGSVADEPRRQIAGQLAEALDGIIAVDNRLYIETALDRRLEPVLAEGIERTQRLVNALPLLAMALLIVLAFNWLGRWLSSRPRLFRRLRRNPFLNELARQAIGIGLTVIGILIALDLLGATALVGAVLGAAGVVGIALGFAFKDIVENYVAGVLLSLRQPFAPNDHVRVDGHEGRVAALTSRATTLITPDGNHLRLPNSLVFKGVILNYSRNPTRQFSFDVAVGTSDDLALAQSLAIDALRRTPGVIDDPPPSALVAALADSSVRMTCSAWVNQREASFGKVRSEAIRAVKARLEDAGIELPEPLHRVQLLHPADNIASPSQSRHAKTRTAATAATSADIAVEHHVEQQVQEEAESKAEQNLLSAEAARE